MGILYELRQYIPGLEYKTKTERFREAAWELSEAYPDTPDWTVRCGVCEEITPVEEIVNQTLKKTDDEMIETVLYCENCTSGEKEELGW